MVSETVISDGAGQRHVVREIGHVEFAQVYDSCSDEDVVTFSQDSDGMTLMDDEYGEYNVSSSSSSRGLIAKYMEICDKRLESIEELEASDSGIRVAGEVALKSWWKIEKASWALIATLLELRLTGPAMHTEGSISHLSDFAIVNKYVEENQKVAEMIRVKEWLEAFAPEGTPLEPTKGYRPYTARELAKKDAVAKKLVPNLDFDAPIKHNKSLAAEDKTFETQLLRTLFEYVRAGKLSEALQCCVDCDHAWRAASLSGGIYARDPVGDGTGDEPCSGNVNRNLWKYVSHELAKNPKYDQYERALYAALIGDVKNVLPVCSTWEDFVWAYYCGTIEHDISKYLDSIPSLDEPEEIEHLDWDEPSIALKPLQIFEQLSKHDNLTIRMEAQSPMRTIQTMWILDRMDKLFENVHNVLHSDQVSIPNMPHVVRFLAHVILILKRVDYPIRAMDMAHSILATYVDMLRAARLTTIVTTFTSVLPANLQVDVHSAVFYSLPEDREVRETHLTLAEKAGCNTAEICIATVGLFFNEAFEQERLLRSPALVYIADWEDDMNPQAIRLIGSLEWLLFNTNLRAEAILRCNQLARKFLLSGRINSVRRMFDVLPQDFIRQDMIPKVLEMAKMEDDNPTLACSPGNREFRAIALCVAEHFSYKDLIYSFETCYNWSLVYKQQPPAYQRDSYQFKDWVETIKTHSTETEAAVRKVLELKWLELKHILVLPEDQENERLKELQLIRQIYIAEAVTLLYKILYSTHEHVQGNLEKANQVLEMLKSGDNVGYKDLLESGRMPQVLASIERLKQ